MGYGRAEGVGDGIRVERRVVQREEAVVASESVGGPGAIDYGLDHGRCIIIAIVSEIDAVHVVVGTIDGDSEAVGDRAGVGCELPSGVRGDCGDDCLVAVVVADPAVEEQAVPGAATEEIGGVVAGRGSTKGNFGDSTGGDTTGGAHNA